MLKLSEFKNWLMEQKGRKWINYYCCDCPLASYLNAQTNKKYSVTPSGYLYEDNQKIDNPTWTGCFVHMIDKIRFYAADKTVTEQDCLSVVTQLESEFVDA